MLIELDSWEGKMMEPRWVVKLSKKNRSDIRLSEYEYHECFKIALRQMSSFLYGNENQYLLHDVIRDDKIDTEEAARRHFYSNFKLSTRDDVPVIEYYLSEAFFAYSFRGLYSPENVKRDPGESEDEFIRDCATNYLIKNFWHNYVHDKVQGITDTNYREFRQEARYFSDFEADNYANILLPLSYGLTIAADHTTQYHERPAVARLFERNRCNAVFRDRAGARKDFPAPGGSYDSLMDWEWQIRRRFANQLAMRLIERNRAVSSITMHFFGEVKAKRSKFTRPKAAASIELNGVRFSLGELGNVGVLTDDNIKGATRDYVTMADVKYSERLFNDEQLRKHAINALRVRCAFLLSRPVNDLIVKAAKLTEKDEKPPR